MQQEGLYLSDGGEFTQSSTFYKHGTPEGTVPVCYVGSCGQKCDANVPPVQLQPEELGLSHWGFHLQEHLSTHSLQRSADPTSVGIGDIEEGLIFQQKDWDCLQSAAPGCFTLRNRTGKILTASSHSLATDIEPVWVTWLQAVVWLQPVWFITCLNIKSVFF